MQHMLQALQVGAGYAILIGLISLSPSLVSSVFAYDVKDRGILLVFAGVNLAFGVVVWGLSTDSEKYRPMAPYVAVAFAIVAVLLAWGWISGLFTIRTVIVPLIINIVLTIWFWLNRPKS